MLAGFDRANGHRHVKLIGNRSAMRSADQTEQEAFIWIGSFEYITISCYS